MRSLHGGDVLRSENDNVYFENMVEDVMLFNSSPTFANLVDRVKERLHCQGVSVTLDGVVDVGSSNGPRVKRMAPISTERDWDA